MGNEEKIIAMLEALTVDVADLKRGQAKLEQGQAKLERGQAMMQADISAIKAYAEVTRSATNRLVEWADEVEHAVKFPLPAL